MQVISKSELLQTLKEIQCQMYRNRIDGVGAVSWFSDIVNEQTIIDAVPVVHGQWIPQLAIEKTIQGVHSCHTEYRCSICNEIELKDSDYCPNCGAKMDLK